MQPWDERAYQSIALKRSRFFRPAAAVLAALRITPDVISYAGVGAMAAFVLVINHSLTVAFWLMIAMLICDQLDGAVARLQKTTSDRGKFVDVLADSTSFSLFMVGLIHVGLVGAAAGAMLIYLVVLTRVLAAIRKNAGRSSDWLFYAGAGPFPSTFIYCLYGLFGLEVFAAFDRLAGTVVIFSVLLGLLAIRDYFAVRYAKVKKST